MSAMPCTNLLGSRCGSGRAGDGAVQTDAAIHALKGEFFRV